jgi:UDP-glucose 4-epimerase
VQIRGKSVLVTGGAGFIGSHLVDRLIAEEPAQLTVVDNFFLGSEANLASARSQRADLEVIRLDASDLAAMQDVVTARKVDAVFDLAVVPLPTSLVYPAWTVATNVGIATTFCEIARRGLVERLLHCSSSEAYGTARYVPMDEEHPRDALTPYAASKSAADQVIDSYIKTFGIDATTVRPFNNFGPRQNPGTYAGIIPIIVNNVRDGVPVQIHGDGEQTRDFLFVRKTADMIVQVFQSAACRGTDVNVATGVETSVNDLVRRMLQVLGVPDHPVVHTDPRPGDVRRHCADVAKARKLLGTSPEPMSDDELAETIDWYRSALR